MFSTTPPTTSTAGPSRARQEVDATLATDAAAAAPSWQRPVVRVALVVDGGYLEALYKRGASRAPIMHIVNHIKAMVSQGLYEVSLRILYVGSVYKEDSPLHAFLRANGFDIVACKVEDATDWDPAREELYSFKTQMGADTFISSYIMMWTLLKKYLYIFVLTGDGDFYPVFERAQKLDQAIILMHFDNTVSRTLTKYCWFMNISDWFRVCPPVALVPSTTAPPAPLDAAATRTLFLTDFIGKGRPAQDPEELEKALCLWIRDTLTNVLSIVVVYATKARCAPFAKVMFKSHLDATNALVEVTPALFNGRSLKARLESDKGAAG